MVRMVEEGFALSEASNMPAMLQLRIRACHVRGSFECRDNVAPAMSDTAPDGRSRRRSTTPAGASAGDVPRRRSSRPTERIPAARRYIAEHRLNEHFPGARDDLGLIVQGGLYNYADRRAAAAVDSPMRSAQRAVAILVLNVTVSAGARRDIGDFCAGKRAVLIVEEGQPEFIEQEILATLRRARASRRRCTARTCCRWPANTRSR